MNKCKSCRYADHDNGACNNQLAVAFMASIPAGYTDCPFFKP